MSLRYIQNDKRGPFDRLRANGVGGWGRRLPRSARNDDRGLKERRYEAGWILTYMQNSYGFETGNNIVGDGNPHERT